MNNIFLERAKSYFKQDFDKYIKELDNPCTQAFFLNTNKASREEILSLVDFEYYKSDITNNSFYHSSNNIGKTKAYELGLIYPQEIAASISSNLIKTDDIKIIVDLCSAPGGKSINILNKVNKDALCICNDVNHTRANILSSNLERLGLDNTIVTCKSCEDLADQLENYADLVILDAPCSGEGMIRKYPEILDKYSIDNINELALIQKNLLDCAYKILKPNGQLIYSTCTYSFEEDEYQITNFLNKYKDMHLLDLGNPYSSQLKETIKLSPINNTEGQFIALMKKEKNTFNENKIRYLKSIKDNIVDNFIKDNLKIDNYFLYKQNDHYYMSFKQLPDFKYNVLRYGIYVGDIVKNRFEPSHFLYRTNSLIDKFMYKYELNDNEYEKFIYGNELRINCNNGYYLLTYKDHSLGFGKCSNGQLKNKYPKGLRRV